MLIYFFTLYQEKLVVSNETFSTGIENLTLLCSEDKQCDVSKNRIVGYRSVFVGSVMAMQ